MDSNIQLTTEPMEGEYDADRAAAESTSWEVIEEWSTSSTSTPIITNVCSLKDLSDVQENEPDSVAEDTPANSDAQEIRSNSNAPEVDRDQHENNHSIKKKSYKMNKRDHVPLRKQRAKRSHGGQVKKGDAFLPTFMPQVLSQQIKMAVGSGIGESANSEENSNTGNVQFVSQESCEHMMTGRGEFTAVQGEVPVTLTDFGKKSEGVKAVQPTPVLLLMPTKDGFVYCPSSGPQSKLAYMPVPKGHSTTTDLSNMAANPLHMDTADSFSGYVSQGVAPNQSHNANQQGKPESKRVRGNPPILRKTAAKQKGQGDGLVATEGTPTIATTTSLASLNRVQQKHLAGTAKGNKYGRQITTNLPNSSKKVIVLAKPVAAANNGQQTSGNGQASTTQNKYRFVINPTNPPSLKGSLNFLKKPDPKETARQMEDLWSILKRKVPPRSFLEPDEAGENSVPSKLCIRALSASLIERMEQLNLNTEKGIPRKYMYRGTLSMTEAGADVPVLGNGAQPACYELNSGDADKSYHPGTSGVGQSPSPKLYRLSEGLLYNSCFGHGLSKQDLEEEDLWQTVFRNGKTLHKLQHLGVVRFMDTNIFTFDKNGQLYFSLGELFWRALLPRHMSEFQTIVDFFDEIPESIPWSEVAHADIKESAFIHQFVGSHYMTYAMITPYALLAIYERLGEMHGWEEWRVYSQGLFYRQRLGHQCFWTLQVTPPTGEKLPRGVPHAVPAEGQVAIKKLYGVVTAPPPLNTALQKCRVMRDGGMGTSLEERNMSGSLRQALLSLISSRVERNRAVDNRVEPFCYCDPDIRNDPGCVQPLTFDGVPLPHITEMRFMKYDGLHCFKREMALYVSLLEFRMWGLLPGPGNKLADSMLKLASESDGEVCQMLKAETVFLSQFGYVPENVLEETSFQPSEQDKMECQATEQGEADKRVPSSGDSGKLDKLFKNKEEKNMLLNLNFLMKMYDTLARTYVKFIPHARGIFSIKYWLHNCLKELENLNCLGVFDYESEIEEDADCENEDLSKLSCNVQIICSKSQVDTDSPDVPSLMHTIVIGSSSLVERKISSDSQDVFIVSPDASGVSQDVENSSQDDQSSSHDMPIIIQSVHSLSQEFPTIKEDDSESEGNQDASSVSEDDTYISKDWQTDIPSNNPDIKQDSPGMYKDIKQDISTVNQDIKQDILTDDENVKAENQNSKEDLANDAQDVKHNISNISKDVKQDISVVNPSAKQANTGITKDVRKDSPTVRKDIRQDTPGVCKHIKEDASSVINPLVHAATGNANSTGGSMHQGINLDIVKVEPVDVDDESCDLPIMFGSEFASTAHSSDQNVTFKAEDIALEEVDAEVVDDEAIQFAAFGDHAFQAMVEGNDAEDAENGDVEREDTKDEGSETGSMSDFFQPETNMDEESHKSPTIFDLQFKMSAFPLACSCEEDNNRIYPLKVLSIQQCYTPKKYARGATLTTLSEVGQAIIDANILFMFKSCTHMFFSASELLMNGILHRDVSWEELHAQGPKRWQRLCNHYERQFLTHQGIKVTTSRLTQTMISAELLCYLSYTEGFTQRTGMKQSDIYIHQTGHICPNTKSLAHRALKNCVNINQLMTAWRKSCELIQKAKAIEQKKMPYPLWRKEIENIVDMKHAEDKDQPVEMDGNEGMLKPEDCVLYIRRLHGRDSSSGDSKSVSITKDPQYYICTPSWGKQHADMVPMHQADAAPAYTEPFPRGVQVKEEKKDAEVIPDDDVSSVIFGAMIPKLADPTKRNLRGHTYITEEFIKRTLSQRCQTRHIIMVGNLYIWGRNFCVLQINNKLYLNLGQCSYKMFGFDTVYTLAQRLRVFVYKVPYAFLDQVTANVWQTPMDTIQNNPWICVNSLMAIYCLGITDPNNVVMYPKTFSLLWRLFVETTQNKVKFRSFILFPKQELNKDV